MSSTENAPPFSASQLKDIAEDACDKAFGSATEYDHSQTESWNGSIINSILTALASPSQPSESDSAQQPKYKYAVTSTIIQHLSSPAAGTSTGTSTDTTTGGDASEAVNGADEGGMGNAASAGVKPQAGRRGMHSATGAYWNSNTDGMWSFKWEQGEKRGCDVVVSVLWIQA